MAQVIILATLATKRDETTYLLDRLKALGITSRCVDISIQSAGTHLDGEAKCRAMREAAENALTDVQTACAQESHAVVAIGGGTGGEIALQILRALPINFPKVLLTTLPFDPRIAVADNSIILVPSLADINGLNTMLRNQLTILAAMTAGLCQHGPRQDRATPSPTIGITALGVTDAAVRPLISKLTQLGEESTVFHANGFGGAAYVRYIKEGAFKALIDLTPHEITRFHVAGPHVNMPDRFAAGADLPRITLPGGLNFATLTDWALAPERFQNRPHYAHSEHFTHVKITYDEMEMIAQNLAKQLSTLSGPQTLIVPMGGFSSEDRPGGAIEDPKLREVFLETMRSTLRNVPITVSKAHISAPDVTKIILSTLQELTK